MVAGSAPTGAAAAGGRTSVACGGGRAEQDLLSPGNPMDNSDLSTGEDLSEEEADPIGSGSPRGGKGLGVREEEDTLGEA